jgi:hypothetical protein
MAGGGETHLCMNPPNSPSSPTTNNSAWLLDHRSDVFSQGGEDGVIAKILDTLPLRDGWCVEFGAWDGKHLSNCANLVLNRQYHSIMIEADETKFHQLRQNYRDNSRVIAQNRNVGFDDNDNLDVILRDSSIPYDFDFLSIDIDGNDYHVWQATRTYRPKLVCVEFNPTIGAEIDFVQPADHRIKQGSSLASITKLAKTKQYELVCALPFNAFYVRSELFPLFNIDDNSVRNLWMDDSYVTQLFSGYDGTIFLMGARRLPWHDLPLNARRFQMLPKALRRYAPDYSWAQRQAFRALCKGPDRLRQLAHRLGWRNES